MTVQPALFDIPVPRPRVKENSALAGIVRKLHDRQYLTLHTNEHRRPVQCPACEHSFTPEGGDGRPTGLPDLLVSHLEWPAGIWYATEIKGSHTALSKRQQELRALQRIRVVRDPDAALQHLQEFEEWRQGLGDSHIREVAELEYLLLETSRAIHDVICHCPDPAGRGELRMIKRRIDDRLRR